MKICSKCKESLPLDAFYKGKSYKGGYRPLCKRCVCQRDYYEKHEKNLERAKQYREGHREEARERSRLWREANPEKTKEQQRSHYAKNRDKEREDSRRYRASHPEQYREYRRSRRVKLLGVARTLTVAQWKEILLRFKNRCAYCDKKDVALTMDHVIPVSKGGDHTASNVVPACKRCNSSKQANKAPHYVQTMLVA